MDHLRARVTSNSTYAFLSQIIRLLSNLLLFVGIARLYGVESFGQFTTAHTLSTMFLLAADFGFDTLLPTQIATQSAVAWKVVRRYFSLKVLFAFTASLAMVTVSFLADFGPNTVLLVRVFAGYVLFGSLSNFFFAVFKGFEQFQHEARISLVTSLILLVLLVIMGALHLSLLLVGVAFVATRVITVALCIRQVRNMIGDGALGFTLEGWRDVIPKVMVFGLHFLFGNLFFQMDTILLAALRGDHEVGIYQGAFKLVVLTLIVPDIAVTSMLPVLSNLYARDQLRWRELGRLLNKILFLLSLPVAMFLFAFPGQIVRAVYGEGAFTEAVPVVRIFALTVFLRFCVDAYALMLTTADRQGERMRIVMVGTVVNVVLNFYVIPRYGAVGAAVVSLITNLVVGAAYIWRSRMSFFAWSLEGRSLLLLGGTVVVAGVMSQMGDVSLWLAIPAVAILYGFGLYRVGLRPEERAMLFGTHGVISIPPTDGV